MDSESQDFQKKLIQSHDPEDKKILNAIVMKMIAENNDDSFASLLANGYKVDVLNEKKQTALHYAFYNHNPRIIKMIVHWVPFRNDDSNCIDSNGLTHFHIACSDYHTNGLELIKRYIINGSDINSRFHSDPSMKHSQFTPLHFAIIHYKFDIVWFLLENGADSSAVDSKGKTPLHLACQLTMQKNFLQTLHLLAIRFLSDIEARDKDGNTPLLNIFDEYDNMELEFDIIDAKSKFDVLLLNGANIMARNNKGDTILHLVIKTLRLFHCHFYLPYMSFNDTTHAELVRQILNINMELLETKNNDGETPLQLAVSMTSADVVKVLLDHNADLSFIKIDCENENIFCYPKMVPNFDIVHNIISMIQLMVNRGFKLTLKNNLIILKFLVHEIDSCQCTDDEYSDNVLGKTFTALEFSTPIHAKWVLNELKGKNALDLNYLWHYLNLMKAGNFYLDKEVKEIVTSLTFSKYNNYVMKVEAEKELIRLKSDVKFKNGMMLYDLMIKHPYTKFQLFTDDNFDLKIIDNFSYYKTIIQGYVTKSIVRNYIIKSAYNYLKFSPLSSLSDLCNEIILNYLSNIDIFNLCSTVFY